jgi:peptidylprolyl isomerase/peptidyl-prolyl cis-trans isomerase C
VVITEQELQQPIRNSGPSKLLIRMRRGRFSAIWKKPARQRQLAGGIAPSVQGQYSAGVGCQPCARISDVEIGIYYHLHAEQFHLLKARSPAISSSALTRIIENTHETALIRAQELAENCVKNRTNLPIWR